MAERPTLLGDVIAAFVGLALVGPFTWFAVDWPTPLPIVPRVLGYVFFGMLGTLGGVAMRRGA